MARVAGDVGEVVDLGVEADGAPIDDQPEGHFGVPGGHRARDRERRVGFVVHAEQDLVLRVVEPEEALEVGLEAGVGSFHRLEDAYSRKLPGRLAGTVAELADLCEQHHRQQREAGNDDDEQGKRAHRRNCRRAW